MELDINKFLEDLNRQPRTEEEISEKIVAEIRRAEDFKISLMEDLERHRDYVVEITAKIDTYVFQLQELEKNILPFHLPLDQQSALSDELVRKRMAEYIDTLKKFNNKPPGLEY